MFKPSSRSTHYPALMSRLRSATTAVAATTAALLTACTSTGTGDRPPRPDAGCLPVSPVVLERLAGAVRPGSGPLVFSSGVAVKETAETGAPGGFVVAASFTGPKAGSQIGVWSLSTLAPPGGLTRSLNPAALTATLLPGPEQAIPSELIERAMTCLRAQPTPRPTPSDR